MILVTGHIMPRSSDKKNILDGGVSVQDKYRADGISTQKTFSLIGTKTCILRKVINQKQLVTS